MYLASACVTLFPIVFIRSIKRSCFNSPLFNGKKRFRSWHMVYDTHLSLSLSLFLRGKKEVEIIVCTRLLHTWQRRQRCRKNSREKRDHVTRELVTLARASVEEHIVFNLLRWNNVPTARREFFFVPSCNIFSVLSTLRRKR